MANKWTDEQLEAINSIDKSTIVSAAAGSGKTAVLVERTIRMLSDANLDIEADRLLAVTFTNDAANNMKEKLSSAMTKALEQNPENHWVQKQKDLLSLATICTIDAFCMELVKNNINDLDISGNFSMIDEQENKLLTEKAFLEASKCFFKEYPDKMKILMDNFAEETDADVLENGMELYKFKGSLPFPEMWKKNAEDNFDKSIEDFYDIQFKKEILPSLNVLKNAIKGIENAQEKLNTNKYLEVLEGMTKIYNKVIENVKLGEDFALIKEFDDYKEIKYPRKPTKRTLEEGEIYDEIATIKKSVENANKALAKVVVTPKSRLIEDKERTIEVFGCLWDYVNKAEEILWEYKLDRNKFYFSDITRLTIKLLAKQTEDGFVRTDLANRIRDEKRYKMILIDEFQDVNNLQNVIFKCISDTDDMRILGKNVFVVGDMKQSIYSFRQSNPNIFDEARVLAREKENSDKCNALYLTKNFRSKQSVLDFTNFVFENVMSKELGEVDYDENERLSRGLEFDSKEHQTEVILYDDKVYEINSSDYDLSTEPLIVAEKVKSMISNKEIVEENGKARPCRAGDFCVLLRTNKLVNEYIKAFERYGIQAVGDSVKGFLGAREIRLALSILKILDNPMNDIPFVAVCLSPIFGFTTDEIAKIRKLDKDKKFYSIFLGIARENGVENYGYEKIEIDSQSIVKKCKNAVELIKKLRFYASGMSLEKLVRKVYDITDLMSVANRFEKSQQKQANLRMLVRYADNYEQSTGGGLSDFLRYLDNVSKSGNDFDEVMTVLAGKNTALVKTIHKSKGLEYPFVIVGDMSKEYNIPKRTAKVVFNEKNGYGVSLRNEGTKLNYRTLFYDYCYDKNVLAQKSEELRILYVALTRAKEKLILPICLKSKARGRIKRLIQNLTVTKRVQPTDIEKLLSYSELIFTALMFSTEKDMLEAYLDMPIDVFLLSKTIPDVKVDLFDTNDVSQDNSVKGFDIPKPDNALMAKIIEEISFVENSDDTETVSKLSVTEFVREVEEGKAQKEITYFPPLPELENDNISSAAQKGTDTHLFMELCDFENASKNVSAEIKRLVQSHMLNQSQAENVNVDTVKSFFSSEIYELCKNAENIYREKDFKVKLSDLALDNSPLEMYNNKDVLIQGIADLIVQTSDGIYIVDYKTDNVKTPLELIDRHFVQLLLYKKAFELVYAQKVLGCYIYSFKLEKSIKLDF